jgi:hypothetical protein
MHFAAGGDPGGKYCRMRPMPFGRCDECEIEYPRDVRGIAAPAVPSKIVEFS